MMRDHAAGHGKKELTCVTEIFSHPVDRRLGADVFMTIRVFHSEQQTIPHRCKQYELPFEITFKLHKRFRVAETDAG
jgi:hypothetical protein